MLPRRTKPIGARRACVPEVQFKSLDPKHMPMSSHGREQLGRLQPAVCHPRKCGSIQLDIPTARMPLAVRQAHHQSSCALRQVKVVKAHATAGQKPRAPRATWRWRPATRERKSLAEATACSRSAAASSLSRSSCASSWSWSASLRSRPALEMSSTMEATTCSISPLRALTRWTLPLADSSSCSKPRVANGRSSWRRRQKAS
mmetsp:Transcript_1616/g.3648  ORF Transcript_1616/g.3648 Transcript_1616/m.3648 type:complete len:202 (-) Transcript_1616:180-785(-)